MTVHTTIRPGVKNEADMRNLTDPWHGDWSDKKKAHEKLIDGFRIWQDDISLWKGVMRGEWSRMDESSLRCTDCDIVNPSQDCTLNKILFLKWVHPFPPFLRPLVIRLTQCISSCSSRNSWSERSLTSQNGGLKRTLKQL